MTERDDQHQNLARRTAATSDRQPRANRDERSAELLRYASEQVIEQGGFPVSYDRLARAAGVSKALIYNYFPTQFGLGTSLVAKTLSTIDRQKLRHAIAQQDLTAAARDCALIYFDMLAETGPLLHILLADPYLARGPDRSIFGQAALLLLPVARRIRRSLALSPREATVVMHLLLTLPEEAGRKAFGQKVDIQLTRSLCGDTVEASIAALREKNTTLSEELLRSSDFT